MAYSIVTVYGMNKEIGNLSFYDSKQSEYNFQKPYSDATAERIDIEVKKIIDESFERTKNLLTKHRDHLEVIAKELLEKEILFQADLERLIGKRPFAAQTTYQKFTNGQSVSEKKEEAERLAAEKNEAASNEADSTPVDSSVEAAKEEGKSPD
jgi:cell division protease FtsH